MGFETRRARYSQAGAKAQQTIARMTYLENHTSVLLGVFFIVTGVKN